MCINCLFRLITCLLVIVICQIPSNASASTRKKYPGGKYYIWRYTLKDKQGSPYSLEHPGRWLSHKAIERRKRQGLSVDSTDLPVSARYLRQIENSLSQRQQGEKRPKAEWVIVGTSRWNNTVLVRANDTILLNHLATLDCVAKAQCVWTSPDSIDRYVKYTYRETFNPWDSIKGVTYGNGKDQLEMLQGQRLHSIGLRGKGVTIAVLDGGFQNVNVIPAFTRANIVSTKDFVYPNSPFFYQETDHGTKVLSTMAINEPNVLIGTAPYNDYDGAPTYYHQRDLDGKTALISRTASMLAKKGIILVNSAGNSGMGPWKKISFPADANDILTVGAVNPEKKNAPFSGVGPTQDGRVKPDVMALGSPAALISGRGSIVRDMGTSFSTPIVAGLVACLWQALPEKTALEIIELVRQTSSYAKEPDNIFGYGIPNFWRAYMIGKAEKK